MTDARVSLASASIGNDQGALGISILLLLVAWCRTMTRRPYIIDVHLSRLRKRPPPLPLTSSKTETALALVHNRTTNMFSPAYELPIELLRHIFAFLPEIPPVEPSSWKKNVEYALAPPLPPTVTRLCDRTSRRGWINAAFICRHWREVVFSMNRTIPIRIAPEKSNKDIRRCVSTVFTPLPVVLYVEQHLLERYGFGDVSNEWGGFIEPESHRSAPMLRFISALGGRVVGIYIYLSNTTRSIMRRIAMSPYLFHFIRSASQLLPSFTELHLIAPGRNHRHGPRSTQYTEDGVLNFPGHLLLGTRELSILELRDCHFADPESVFASTKLRKLTLIASTDSWPPHVTTNLKQLEYMCLTLESIPKKDTIAKMDRIELPSLRHLHLGGYMYNIGALLPKLSCPPSTTIELRCDYNASTAVDNICPLVSPLAEHLAGSCSGGEGFTSVALRVYQREIEIMCSSPMGRKSSSLLSPSTSITVSLACRLNPRPLTGRGFTTDIFSDLVGGMCARLPQASAVGQTLEVIVPSPKALGSEYGYWVDAALALRDINDMRVDYNTAQHLLALTNMRRAQQAGIPFPHLGRITILPGHYETGYSEKIQRHLLEEISKRGVNGAVFCGHTKLC